MHSRIEYMEIAPDAMKPMLRLEKYLGECGLEPPLLDLIKLRASQINGCAYCIDRHTKDARARGESEQRLGSTSLLPGEKHPSIPNESGLLSHGQKQSL